MDVLEDIKADAIAVEVALDKDVVTRVDVGIDMEVDVGVDVEDEVEDEVESSDRGTIEVRVDVIAGIDIPDGMLIPDAVEHLEQVEEGLQDIYEHNMTITRSSMTPEAIEELFNRRVEEALAAYEATYATNTLEAKSQSQNGSDGDNGNGGNRNGNGRSCRVDKRTIRADATFSMSWRELMKLMAEVYCPRNEIQKMESELWNLTMKNNDLAAYTQRFQELTMMYTKMVPEEEDQVKKFIGGLQDNIQGNVIAAEPTRLQDVV
ncbi:putative reverse transcriptase domain-containing protein [Tanacetum coccineum]